jgi:hypothetical protein
MKISLEVNYNIHYNYKQVKKQGLAARTLEK